MTDNMRIADRIGKEVGEFYDNLLKQADEKGGIELSKEQEVVR